MGRGSLRSGTGVTRSQFREEAPCARLRGSLALDDASPTGPTRHTAVVAPRRRHDTAPSQISRPSRVPGPAHAASVVSTVAPIGAVGVVAMVGGGSAWGVTWRCELDRLQARRVPLKERARGPAPSPSASVAPPMTGVEGDETGPFQALEPEADRAFPNVVDQNSSAVQSLRLRCGPPVRTSTCQSSFSS